MSIAVDIRGAFAKTPQLIAAESRTFSAAKTQLNGSIAF